MAHARFNRPFERPPARNHFAGWIALLSLVACGHGRLHPAPITGNDELARPSTTRPQTRFVSPYTYEWFIRAELFRAQGNLREAADGYRRALAGADEDPLVLARLALTVDALGDTNEARDLLAHADSLDPVSEAVWMARGEIAERHNRLDDAIAAYERAEMNAPHSATPVWALAHALREAPERSRAVLRRFAARNDRWNPHRLHMELRLDLDERDLESAQASLHALRTITTATTREVEAVARLALERGRPFLAREVMGEWLPTDHDPRLWMNVLIATRDLEQAERVLATATPEQLGGLAATAALTLELGDAERAAQLATLSLHADPHALVAPTLLRAHGLDALATEVEAGNP